MYALFPIDQMPRVVDAKLTDSRISDDLGGTFVDASLSPTTAVIMRDDFAGLPFNPAATLLVAMTVGYAVPFYGPVILAGLDAIAEAVNPGTGEHGYIGRTGPLPANIAQAAIGVATPGLLVYGDRAPEGVDPTFIKGIREVFESATAVKLPTGYPGCDEPLNVEPLSGYVGRVRERSIRKLRDKYAEEFSGETIIDTDIYGPFGTGPFTV